MPLHTRILLGLVVGAIAGVATNLITHGGTTTEGFIHFVTEPIGKIWLSGLIMTVIPLVVSSLALGVARLGDLRKLGRMGAVTLASFLSLTAISVVLGLVAMNVLKPGGSLDPDLKSRLMETYQGQTKEAMGLSSTTFDIDLLINIVPRNPVKAAAEGDMLAVIVFTLVLGVALATLPTEKAKPLLDLLESLGDATIAIIHMVMQLAPLGVFCLVFSVTARFGFDLLLNLFQFVFAVVGTLAFLYWVGYPIVLKFVAKRNPWEFLRKIRVVSITAFSTSSSNATLPTTIETAEEELGIPPEIAGFVLPLGATLNMNGTAMFEGAVVLFLAQVFGIPLSALQQLAVVVLSVIAGIGTAGIPGGSLPLIMMILGAVGVPMEGIAIVMGVDRFLDMCRTVVNVTGDLVTAAIVTRVEAAIAPAAVAVPEVAVE